MFEELLLAAFCFLATLVGLAIAAWEVISGRVFNIDGLWFTLISLSLATVFGGTLGWSFYTREGQEILRHLRKRSAPKEVPEKSPPNPS